jgi:hypothetical protein
MVSVNVPGFAVLTQTCDLIRPCSERALVRVAALASLGTDDLNRVKRGYRPRYAFIGGVAGRGLAADLDNIMTVEKAIIAAVPPEKRVRGCQTDLEMREFAWAVARNLSRTAFPDDFVFAFQKIQQRIQEKHGKTTYDAKNNPTNEGVLLAAVREIRVSCAPSWDAADVTLTFYFIFDRPEQIPTNAEDIITGLLKRFRPTGSFRDPSFRIVTISQMSAAAYLSSDALDLDQLSLASQAAGLTPGI